MSFLMPAPSKPAKVPPANTTIWSTKLKVFLLFLGILIYYNMLLYLKTMCLKSKRLDRMAVMALETKQMMHQVHAMDQNMAMNMERIEDIYGDY